MTFSAFIERGIVVLVISLTTILIGCKGNDGKDGLNGINGVDGVSDKQIRLRFLGLDVYTTDTNWTISADQQLRLIKFDKRNYLGVDSIIFTCPLSCLDSGNTVYADLYDITDSASIQHSQVQFNSPGYLYCDSKNIFPYLPNKEINLGVRVKSRQFGIFVFAAVDSYLFLYRK